MTTTTVADPASDPMPAGRTAGGARRWQLAIGALGLLVVFWVGDRLYTIIDRGAMGPGMEHGPGGGSPEGPPTAGNPTPGSEQPTQGGHDPSQFGHGAPEDQG